MDDIQKSKVRLAHWIEHNVDHLKGYEEVAGLLEREGKQTAALMIRKGIESIKSANREFEQALQELSGPGEEAVHHSHGRGHDHGHKHGG